MLGQAVSNLKAAAAGNSAKPEPHKEVSIPKPERVDAMLNTAPERSRESTKPQLSSGLPPDFFDNNETQKHSNRQWRSN